MYDPSPRCSVVLMFLDYGNGFSDAHFSDAKGPYLFSLLIDFSTAKQTRPDIAVQ